MIDFKFPKIVSTLIVTYYNVAWADTQCSIQIFSDSNRKQINTTINIVYIYREYFFPSLADQKENRIFFGISDFYISILYYLVIDHF